MSSHVTLRGLMGLGDGPAPLQDSALIMIDCQNTYRRGVMQLDGAEDAFAEAARMLARARASGIPVFHIMHDAGQGSPYDVTAEIGQISDEVAPIAAFNLGYRPTVVASTTATRELPVPSGAPVPAATLQTATLAGIADLFAVVAGTPDDLPG